jgi:hypothetical protein
MLPDNALEIYHAGSEVVVKALCGFCDTIGSLENRINILENKIAKLLKNSSNSSKRPSSDDITKPKNKKKTKGGNVRSEDNQDTKGMFAILSANMRSTRSEACKDWREWHCPN